MEWKPINTVPLERDVEIGATDSTGMSVSTERGWIAAESKRRLYWVRPTHWRDLSRNELNENSPEAERGGSASPVPIILVLWQLGDVRRKPGGRCQGPRSVSAGA